MDDLAPCFKFLGSLDKYKDSPLELQKCFIELDERPIRIAIIDNGTDKFRSTICTNIEDGVSFTKLSMNENKVLPWWSASDAHGTQMAYLIRNVNPWCRLLPARIGLSQDDIDPALAVQVRLTQSRSVSRTYDH